MRVTYRRTTRRGFLQELAAAAAAPWVIPASALCGEGRPAPSNRIVMGFVGVGAQGTGDMQGFMQFPEVQNVAVCDADRRHRLRAKEIAEQRYGREKAGGTFKGCDDHADFRDLCARPDIDAVFCATPEHWHGPVCCEAMRNGKDAYCEKPETFTIREGRVMTETARRYGRAFSGGSQRVWEDYNWYHRMMWSGAAGDLKEVFIDAGGTPGEALRPAEPVPEWLDWEMFLGPAPWRPYNAAYGGYWGWNGCRDFGGGNMTGWGSHHVGGGLFAAQLHDKPLPVEVMLPGKDSPRGVRVTFKYADGVLLHLGGTWGGGPLSFRGTLGEVPDRHGPKLAPPPVNIPNYKGGRSIFGDFLHCVKTRERPFRDIELAHRTMVVCHLANIAIWLGRGLKFDPVKEEIIGDEEANRWVDRPRRAPWVLEA